MTDLEDFHLLYREKRTPWDTGRPDHNLLRLVDDGSIAPGEIIDIGCGTGTDAIWLARRGFTVTGIDLVPAPLEMATERTVAMGLECEFINRRFPGEDIPNAPFDLAYDRGCFHSQKDSAARVEFARAVAAILRPQGRWISLVGSCDDPAPATPGPPRLTAAETVACVEKFFTIEFLRKGWIESNRGDEHQAWVCSFCSRS